MPKLTSLLIFNSCFTCQFVINHCQRCIKSFDGQVISIGLAIESPQIKIIDLKHAILTLLQRLYFLKFMDFFQKAREYVQSIGVSIIFNLSILILQQFPRSLTLELKKTIHQFVHCVYLYNQKFLIKDLIIFWIYKSKTLCEVGSCFEEIFAFKMVYSILSNSLKIVHENKCGFFSFLAILFCKCLYSFLYLFDLRLILNLWQTQSLDVFQEQFHICFLDGSFFLILCKWCLLKIENKALAGILICTYFHLIQILSEQITLQKLFWFINEHINFYQTNNRPAMYQLQAELGIMKYNSLQRGKINVTLRLGTSLVTQTTQLKESTSQIDLAIKLNLSFENLSQIQRCSITLSFEDGRILGVAIISLPKTINEISNVSKLVQCTDKKAELYFKLKISQVKQQIEQSQCNMKQLRRVIQSGNISPIKRRQSVNNIRNKIKTQSSLQKNGSTTFDKTEVKTTLKTKKLTSQEQINALRQQKEIYCQLYKIEKSKNEVASNFISSLITKLTNQYPELLNCFIETDCISLKRKFSAIASPRQNEQIQLIKHLQQANKSLHRHLNQYKKVNEQLRNQLLKNTRSKTFENANQFIPLRSSISQRSQKLKSPSKQLKSISLFQGLDLKKLLQESIGQRNKLHQLLRQFPKTLQSQTNFDKAKLKLKIDKAFLTLFSKNLFNRESIFIHKREINKIIDELVI